MNLGPTELLIIVVLVVVLLLAARLIRARPADPAGTAAPRVTRPPAALPAELQTQVRGLLAQNQKIHAIKAVREATGLGLADAKHAVDAIESGAAVPTSAAAAPPRADLAYRARSLAATSPAEAVRLITTETGMSAPEAQAFLRSLLEP